MELKRKDLQSPQPVAFKPLSFRFNAIQLHDHGFAGIHDVDATHLDPPEDLSLLFGPQAMESHTPSVGVRLAELAESAED